jgi:hypothetical protein
MGVSNVSTSKPSCQPVRLGDATIATPLVPP